MVLARNNEKNAKIIELWGLDMKTDVEAKKNFSQLTGR